MRIERETRTGTSGRFKVVMDLDSGHDCCFEASVLDTQRDEKVCECFDAREAEAIAAALNAVLPATA